MVAAPEAFYPFFKLFHAPFGGGVLRRELIQYRAVAVYLASDAVNIDRDQPGKDREQCEKRCQIPTIHFLLRVAMAMFLKPIPFTVSRIAVTRPCEAAASPFTMTT